MLKQKERGLKWEKCKQLSWLFFCLFSAFFCGLVQIKIKGNGESPAKSNVEQICRAAFVRRASNRRKLFGRNTKLPLFTSHKSFSEIAVSFRKEERKVEGD